ncbi:MAG: hypothetical protein A4S09_13610 [Proteobacteria bacterium SG_bin7]|nr:MAG: hypothetical protein A4S09_13610 [Proteobacteria bacterium SG_bin7]
MTTLTTFLDPTVDTDKEFSFLSNHLKTIRCESQENIFSKTGRSEEFKIFVVRQGLVKLFTRFNTSQSLDLLYPGLFFANQNGSAYRVDPIATENTEVCFLDDKVLDDLITSDSRFIKNLMIMFANHANKFKATYISAQKNQVYARLATALISDFAHRGSLFNGKVRAKKVLSHEEWALHLQARRESISRAFKCLFDQGAVSKHGNYMFLEDKEKLENLSALHQSPYN